MSWFLNQAVCTMAEHPACPLSVNKSIVLTSSGLCFNDNNLDVIVDLHHFFLSKILLLCDFLVTNFRELIKYNGPYSVSLYFAL